MARATLKDAMYQAIDAAHLFLGATAPNPPVGAVGLGVDGSVLGVAAHKGAGQAHAEAALIGRLRETGRIDQLHTVVCTLEPCNHTGRTPPCTEAILGTPARRVVYGARDPNPRVAGRGGEYLRTHGLEVVEGVEGAACEALIRQFRHWVLTGRPWVTLKTATRQLEGQETMIPPSGQKTFTSPDSLRLAHELRKRVDAIVTGSGTVLADRPSFTVRHVADFEAKRRWVVVLDRRGRTPRDWVQAQEAAGHRVWVTAQGLGEVLDFLGKEGCLEVLVEAGPRVVEAFEQSGLWNEWVRIRVSESNGETRGKPDSVEIVKASDVHRNH